MKNKEVNFSPKTKKHLDKFVRGLMFFAGILLIFTTFALPFLLLGEKHSNNLLALIALSIGSILILIFGFMLLVLVFKFKYEITLDDTQRVLKWNSLSLAYKKFWILQEVFVIFFCIFMLIFGLISAFYFKNWVALVPLMSCFSLSIAARRQYLDVRNKKEGKILKNICHKILIGFGIALICVLFFVIILNFGKFIMQ